MELDNQQRSSEQENVQRSSPRRGVGRLEKPEMAGLCNCVYGLKDTRDNKIRYIGKTDCALRKRIREHVQDSRRMNNKNCRWIFGRIDRGYDIILIPIMCGIDTLKWEKRFIRNLRRRGFQLLNMTDGGDGVPGNKQSDETKLKKSIALSGKKKSAVHIQKMREASSKEVFMYSRFTGEFLDRFSSTKEAGKSINMDYTGISSSMKRKGNCGDYRFSYEKLDSMPVKVKHFSPTSENAKS